MAYINEQLNKINKVKKQEDKNKKRNKRILVGVLASVFTLAVGVGAFFLIRNALNTVKITQGCNVAGEEGLTIVSQRGNEITLKAKDLNGYRFIGWNVGEEKVSDKKEYTFTIDDNTPNNYTAMYAKEYNVNVDEEISHGTIELDKPIAIAGEEVTITATPEEFYVLKELECKQADETEVAIVENKFTMPESEVTISAEFEKADFNVTLPEDRTGYTITNPDGTPFTLTGVEANSNVSFKIQLDEAYTQSNIVVKDNAIVLTPDNGVYTITNVIKDVNIVVEGVRKNIYSVTLPEKEGYSLLNIDNTELVITSVEHGDNLSFKLTLAPEYSQSEVVVKCNGQTLQLVEGVYTVSNIIRNINITVENIHKNICTITLPATQTGYALMNVAETANFGTTSVEYGDSISFKVILAAAYSQSEVVVKSNGNIIAAENNVYTISNITEDIEITVEGVRKNRYAVTLPEEQVGYTIKNADNTAFNTTSVENGDSLTFKVAVDIGYSESANDLVVKCNGTPVNPENNVYTISNITETVVITIEGLEVNSYTITIPAEVIAKKNGTALTSGDTVYHYDVIVLSPVTQPVEGYVAVYTVTGARKVTGQKNTYSITGNVTIEYDVAEGPKDASEYSTLLFKNYSGSEPYIVEVGANTDNMPTGDLVIPSSVIKDGREYDVTTIYSRGFQSCTRLTSVTIPSSITSINGLAFAGCNGLTKVVISNLEDWLNITFSESYFSSNPLSYAKHLYIGENEVTEVVIPEGMTAIGNYVFYNWTSLTSVTIPSSVTTIEEYAFSGCTGLKKVVISNLEDWLKISFANNFNPLYYAQHLYIGENEVTNLVIPNTVTSIGESTFIGCTGFKTITLEENSQLTSIGSGAFSGCSGLTKVVVSNIEDWLNISFDFYFANPLYYAKHLFIGENEVTELVIPNTITSINDYAFYKFTGLTSVTISNSVISIGEDAFCGCTGLTSVTFDDDSQLTSIGSGAFGHCTGLISVTIPSSITSINGLAFAGCNGLTKVVIPSIEDWLKITLTFDNPQTNPLYYAKHLYIGENEVTEVVIPNTVIGIGYAAFYNCVAITSVVIPSSVTNIGDWAFYNCSALTNVTFDNNSQLESMGIYAFADCTKLTNITLVECSQLTSIGYAAFRNCRSLTSIVIPSSVTGIEDAAFIGCSTLVEVYNLSNLNIEKGSTDNGYVAYYAYEVYTYINEEIKFETINGVTYYKNNDNNYIVLSVANNLTNVTFVENTIGIAGYAFENCTGLTSITIPNTVTKIEYAAFYGCGSLVELTLPFVGNEARNANDYSSGTYAALLGYMFGSSSYAGGISVSQSYYNNSGNSNSYYTYYIPSSLRSVTVLGGDILSGAFYGCSMLTNITLGSGVNLIRNYAFYGCTGLTIIVIPSNVSSIKANAFSGCTNLQIVTIENKTVYGYANSTEDIGCLLANATEVRVLASVVESVTASNKATYLNDITYFTKSAKTTIDGKDYYIFTKI